MPSPFDPAFFDPAFFGSSAIAPATFHCYIDAKDDSRFRYWVDSGAIEGQVEANDGTVLRTFTAIASDVDDAAVTCDESTLTDGSWRVVLQFFSAGTLTERYSNDGENFS